MKTISDSISMNSQAGCKLSLLFKTPSNFISMTFGSQNMKESMEIIKMLTTTTDGNKFRFSQEKIGKYEYICNKRLSTISHMIMVIILITTVTIIMIMNYQCLLCLIHWYLLSVPTPYIQQDTLVCCITQLLNKYSQTFLFSLFKILTMKTLNSLYVVINCTYHFQFINVQIEVLAKNH